MAGFSLVCFEYIFALIFVLHLQSARSDKLLATKDLVIAVPLKNVSIEWTFDSPKDPSEVAIFVRKITPDSAIRMVKLWNIKYGTDKIDKEQIHSNAFTNNTDVILRGNKRFQLLILSAPKDIESYAFICRVDRGMWETALEKEVKIKLASPPVISFDVRNSNGNSTAGGSLSMACSAKGIPDPFVSIKKEVNNVQTILVSSPRNATFAVAQLKSSDNGKYICIAENLAGVVEKEVVVTVKYKPVVDLVIKSGGAVLIAGGPLSIHCDGQGYPKPTMSLFKYADGSWLDIQKSDDNVSFVVENVQPSDAGRYACVASNIAGTSRKEQHIFVQYIDPVVNERREKSSTINREMTLTCDINGYPAPSYAWYKESKALASSGKQLVVRLKIEDDFGDYSCKATNSVGRRTIMFNIRKKYIDRGSKAKQEIITKLGERKSLDCPIKAYPTASFEWIKDKSVISTSSSLLVHLDKKETFGNYTCTGKNDAGKAMFTFELKQSPTTKGRQTDVSAAAGVIVHTFCYLLILLVCYANK